MAANSQGGGGSGNKATTFEISRVVLERPSRSSESSKIAIEAPATKSQISPGLSERSMDGLGYVSKGYEPAPPKPHLQRMTRRPNHETCGCSSKWHCYTGPSKKVSQLRKQCRWGSEWMDGPWVMGGVRIVRAWHNVGNIEVGRATCRLQVVAGATLVQVETRGPRAVSALLYGRASLSLPSS